MKINSKIYYSLLCAMIGDTIGFGNGLVEFNFNNILKDDSETSIKNSASVTNRHIYDFIARGGYSKFDISKLNVSDDTILMLAIYDALISDNKNDNLELKIDFIVRKILEYFNNDKHQDKRAYGIRTMKSLIRLKEGKKWNNFAWSNSAGGSGASMRCMPIGLIYYGEKNRDKLAFLAIQSSRVTHNNGIGYIGGLMSAVFTAYAMENKNPETWIFKFREEFLKNNYIEKFIDNNIITSFKEDKKNHINDLETFKFNVDEYINSRFEKKKFKNNIDNLENRFPELRSIWFYNHFGSRGSFNPGSNGFDSVIIAYDSFLDCRGSFETLIYYSMLHSGDSDTTGCIAGAFYGAYYGKFNLPENLKKVEFLNKLNKLVSNN